MKRGDKLSSKTLAKVYGKQTKAVYDQIKEGSVYILGNPAWPDWVKVGMALDAEDRLNNYQTGGPFRDYVLYYSTCTMHIIISSDVHGDDTMIVLYCLST